MSRWSNSAAKLFAAFGLAIVLAVVLLSAPGLSHAQAKPNLSVPSIGDLPSLPPLFRNLEDSFGTIWDMVITAAGIVFMVLLLIGGLQYLSSAGNEENTKKARTLLLDAIIGLVLVLIAWPIGKYAIDKLHLGNSIKISDASTTAKPAGKATPSGKIKRVTTTVIGSKSGNLQLKSAPAPGGVKLPYLTPLGIGTANAAGYSQTSAITNGEATFTDVPTGETLEYVYNGKILKPITFPCSGQWSLGPRSGQPTLAMTAHEWLTPTAHAATSITGEDDNFSVPGSNKTFEQSSQSKNTSSGSDTFDPFSSRTSNTNKTSSGTKSADPVDNTQDKSADPVDCADKHDEVSVSESIVGKVLVRIAVLHQSTSKPIPNFELALTDIADLTAPGSTVTNENGHAEVYLKPNTQYWVVPNDPAKYGVTTGSGSSSDESLQKLVFTSPSGPIVADKDDLKTNPATVWTISAREEPDGKMITANFKMVDQNNVSLAGKKIIVAQYSTKPDGSDEWNGTFNGGNPIYPDTNGGFSVLLPVGRKVFLRHYSIKKQAWQNDCYYWIKDLNNSQNTCKVTESVEEIYPESAGEAKNVSMAFLITGAADKPATGKSITISKVLGRDTNGNLNTEAIQTSTTDSQGKVTFGSLPVGKGVVISFVRKSDNETWFTTNDVGCRFTVPATFSGTQTCHLGISIDDVK